MGEHQIETGGRAAAGGGPAEATQRRIIDAAERLFRVYGYQKTTVADIARELGMSPANIYRFFASKAALMDAVAYRITSEVEAAVRAAISDRTLPAGERLKRLFLTNHAAIRHRCLADNRMHAMVGAAIEESWQAIAAHKLRMREIIREVVADGVATGEFGAIDPAGTALYLHGALVAACHPQIIEQNLRDEPMADQMIEPLIAFVIGAIARPPAAKAG